MKAMPMLAILGVVLFTTGCSGVKTFPNRVAAGETVAVASGWKHHFSRDNITVSITPHGGASISVPADRIRASINLYPDPLSSMALSNETGTDISAYSKQYAILVSDIFTDGDPDWWETTIFIDLPVSGLPDGLADIVITNAEGESATTTVRIVDPEPSYGGSADVFAAELAGPLNSTHLRALERVDHYVVSFTGPVVPDAVQLDLSYANFTGYVVNPGGLSKNLFWSDDGSGVYRVLAMPTRQQGMQSMSDLKFYVAATTGTAATATLAVVPGSVLAFDQNGNPVSGIEASVAVVRGAAGLN